MSNTDTNVNPMTAFRGHGQALAFARKGGEALDALLFEIAKTKQAERKGPIMAMLFLETHFSDEEGHCIPVVGSKMGETGNKPYDRYTTEVKTQDGKRKVPGSWFTDAINMMPSVQQMRQRIEWCDQGQGEGVPADILAMGSAAKATEKAEIRQFINDMRTGLTKGAMLLHQVEAINLMNPDKVRVKLPIAVQKDEAGNKVNVVRGNLIRLQDPSGELEDEVVTVGSILQYDPEVAAKDPDKGTLKSLKATAAKAPKKTPPGGKGSVLTVPSTVEEIKTLFNVLASGIDQESDEGEKLYAKLLADVSKTTPDAVESRQSIGKVCLALDALWTIIRPAYIRDQEAKAKSAVASMTGTN